MRIKRFVEPRDVSRAINRAIKCAEGHARSKVIAFSIDQDLIELIIASAKAYCEDYLNFDLPETDIPDKIISAQLLVIGDLYRNRSATISTRTKSNPALGNLLFPHRIDLGV